MKPISPYNICPPLFLFVLSVSIAVVPLQQWLLLYLCRTSDATQALQYLPGFFQAQDTTFKMLTSDWEICRTIAPVQAMTARWDMMLSLCSSIPALVTAPLIGLFSDVWGRKPVLILPIVSSLMLMGCLLMISHLGVGLWLLVLVHVVQGMMGSFPIMLSAIFSYIADTTPPETRSRVFVLVEAFIFSGFAIGPVLGGYLTRVWENGVESVFLISMGLQWLTLFYFVFILPESLPSKRRISNSESPSQSEEGQSPSHPSNDASPSNDSSPSNDMRGDHPKVLSITIIKKMMSDSLTLFKTSLNPSMIFLLAGIAASSASMAGRGQNFFYAAYKFGWDSLDEGQYMFVSAISRIGHMVLVFPLLHWIFATTDPRGKVLFDLNVIRIGLFCGTISVLAMALAQAPWIWYAISLVDGFGTLSSPTIRSLISKSMPDSVQGQLFSSIQLMEQIVSLVFAVVFPNVWAMTVGTSMPNLFLFIVMALYAIAFVCTLLAKVDPIVAGQQSSEVEPLIDPLFEESPSKSGSRQHSRSTSSESSGTLSEPLVSVL